MYRFSADDTRLLQEYRTVPSRQRSLDLQRLLARLRTEGTAGKLCILALSPPGTWAIGQLGEHRGDPVRIYDDRRFAAYRDAEWALLKLRWLKHSGLPWPLEIVE